jgi:hypothetical protein
MGRYLDAYIIKGLGRAVKKIKSFRPDLGFSRHKIFLTSFLSKMIPDNYRGQIKPDHKRDQNKGSAVGQRHYLSHVTVLGGQDI